MTAQQPTERLRKRSCWLASGQRQQRSSGEDVSALLLLLAAMLLNLPSHSRTQAHGLPALAHGLPATTCNLRLLLPVGCAGGEREVDADEESYFDKEDSGALQPCLLCSAGLEGSLEWKARLTNLLPPAVQPRLLGNTPRFYCRLPLPRPLAADDDEEPAEAPGSGGNGGGRVVLENTSPLPGLLGPLVDYGADDDEEGDTLPLRGGCRRCSCKSAVACMPCHKSGSQAGWLSCHTCKLNPISSLFVSLAQRQARLSAALWGSGLDRRLWRSD